MTGSAVARVEIFTGRYKRRRLRWWYNAAASSKPVQPKASNGFHSWQYSPRAGHKGLSVISEGRDLAPGAPVPGSARPFGIVLGLIEQLHQGHGCGVTGPKDPS